MKPTRDLPSLSPSPGKKRVFLDRRVIQLVYLIRWIRLSKNEWWNSSVGITRFSSFEVGRYVNDRLNDSFVAIIEFGIRYPSKLCGAIGRLLGALTWVRLTTFPTV